MTARSALPSPVKSAATTACGLTPVEELEIGVRKLGTVRSSRGATGGGRRGGGPARRGAGRRFRPRNRGGSHITVIAHERAVCGRMTAARSGAQTVRRAGDGPVRG